MPKALDAATRTAHAAANIALTREFWDRAINRRDPTGAKALLAPGFVHHEPQLQPGAEGLAAHLAQLLSENPALSIEPARHIADGDFVVAHHRRAHADGEIATIDIMRVSGGKIAEYWHVFQPVPTVLATLNGMF